MIKGLHVIIIFVLFTLPASNVIGQKQNNVWYIGLNLGIDFNQVPPATFDKTPLRCTFPNFTSSICDTSGSILFYTDGIDIWNRYNKKLSKLNNWWPFYEAVMPLMAPYPGNDSLYYFIAASKFDRSVKAVVLNAKGNANNGEIVYPPGSTYYDFYTPLLKKNASLMVAATGHCNQRDLWITTHTGSSFYTYRATPNGIDTNAVISSFTENQLPPGIYDMGNMKFSANGEKLFMPLTKINKMAVFDFDNVTGKFSKPLILEAPPKHYAEDGEISPDGTKIYFDAKYYDEDRELHVIYQMDLDAGDATAVQKTAVVMSPYPENHGCGRMCFLIFRSLQVGPDGKLYVSVQDNTSKVHVIEEPNQKGDLANFNIRKLVFKTAVNTINYNYVRSASYLPKNFAIDVKKNNCVDKPVSFAVLFKHIDSVKWDFGDTASGSRNYSESRTPQHQYPGPGSYNITAIVYHQCFVDTARTVLKILPDEVVKIPASVHDTVLCLGEDLTVNITSPFAKSYFWSDDGNTTPVRQVKQDVPYTVRVQNDCSIATRTFKIGSKLCDCYIIAPSAFTPNKDRLNDIFRPIVKCTTKNYRFSIYSRMGNVIYSTNNPSEGWDGTMGPREAESGTYIWHLTYYDPSKRGNFSKHGTVVLIR